MPAPVFIVRDYGHMCNTLHTFANSAALAAEHGRVLVNLILDRYAQYFAGTAASSVAAFPPGRQFFPEAMTRLVGTDRLCRLLFSKKWRARLSPFLFTIEAPDDFEVRTDFPPLRQIARDRRAIILNAWNIHVPALVERQADNLRAFFSLAPAWQKRLDEWWAAEPRPSPLVGVHLRRAGPNYEKGEPHYRPDEFYAARMAEMTAALGPTTGFILCSDAPVDLAAYAGFKARLGPGHPVLDLYSLARCDWIFGPFSTFSAWASWFGKVPRFQLQDDQPLQLANFRVHQFD
ncbi:MAG: hypothetical protein ABSH19_01330 [Opitutales bacterium]